MTKLAMSVAGIADARRRLSLDVARARPTRSATTRSGRPRRTPPRACRCSVRSARPRRASASAPACSRSSCARHRSHAMAAATLQQLAGDRDVYLGVGISSPAVAGPVARRGLHRPADRAGARVRTRCSASASRARSVTFDGDFYSVKRFRLGVRPATVNRRSSLAALDKQRLRLGGERRRCTAQLPSRVTRAVVCRARPRGRARQGVRVRALGGDRSRPLRRPRAQGSPQLHGRRGPRQSVRRAVASSTKWPLHFQNRSAHDSDGALAAISDDWVDAIQIMGDEKHIAHGGTGVRRQGRRHAGHGSRSRGARIDGKP